MSEKIAYGPEEASKVIGVSRRTIDTYLATGQLRSGKIGRRTIIHRDDLDAFVRERVNERQQGEYVTRIIREG